MIRRPDVPLAFVALLGLEVCSGKAQSTEQYGFTAALGRDMVSVENVTRTGNHLTIDGVDRWPSVKRRHTEIDLGPDGGIRHLVMDIKTPSEPEDQRERHVEATVTADSVVMTKTDKAGVLRKAYGSRGAIVMAHVPQMYSLYELYFSAAQSHVTRPRGDDTVQLRQFYPDREFDKFPLHGAAVRMLKDGNFEIEHDWLAGTGAARVDPTGKLYHYSGARTTYDVEANRAFGGAKIDSFATAFTEQEVKAGGPKRLSVRDTVRATIGRAALTLDYGRPLLRGRVLFGFLIPYDEVWRTGANEATELETSVPLTVAGMAVPAGKYSLWTAPHKNGTADLIINKQNGQWGTNYHANQDLGRVPLKVDTLPTTVETFTISIEGRNERQGDLRLEWGRFRWTAPIVVGGPSGKSKP